MKKQRTLRVTDFRLLIALLSPVTTGFRLKTTGRSSYRISVDNDSIYNLTDVRKIITRRKELGHKPWSVYNPPGENGKAKRDIFFVLLEPA